MAAAAFGVKRGADVGADVGALARMRSCASERACMEYAQSPFGPNPLSREEAQTGRDESDYAGLNRSKPDPLSRGLFQNGRARRQRPRMGRLRKRRWPG
eukprot:6105649-Pleurochrysis_carterae.AAC.1